MYPLKHILEAISTYNRGHSMTETLRLLRQRSQLDLPPGTVRDWISNVQAPHIVRSAPLLRAAGRKLFNQPTSSER